jgi:hypothetical protein
MFGKIAQILAELGVSFSATLAAVSMVMLCCWPKLLTVVMIDLRHIPHLLRVRILWLDSLHEWVFFFFDMERFRATSKTMTARKRADNLDRADVKFQITCLILANLLFESMIHVALFYSV